MNRGIVIELRPKGKSFDYSKIVEDVANGQLVDFSGCDLVQHISLVDSFGHEGQVSHFPQVRGASQATCLH